MVISPLNAVLAKWSYFFSTGKIVVKDCSFWISVELSNAAGCDKLHLKQLFPQMTSDVQHSECCYLSVGRLADGKDERSKLHSVINARRYAAEGTRDNHEGIPLGFQSRTDNDRCVGTRHRRAAGIARHQLRPAQQP